MTNFKKVVLSIVVVLLIVAITTVVSATGDIEIILNSNVDNSPTDILNNTNNTNTNTNTNTIKNNTNTIKNTTTNTNKVTTDNKNLPKTGAEDYLLTLVIAGLAVSAVVAYRKFKFYRGL